MTCVLSRFVDRARIDRVYEIIGKRIEDLRKARGLSQEDLARSSHLKRPSIALIEKGTQKVPIDRLYRIALALGCASIVDLLPGLDDVFGQLDTTGRIRLNFDEVSAKRIQTNPEIEEALQNVVETVVRKRKGISK